MEYEDIEADALLALVKGASRYDPQEEGRNPNGGTGREAAYLGKCVVWSLHRQRVISKYGRDVARRLQASTPVPRRAPIDATEWLKRQVTTSAEREVSGSMRRWLINAGCNAREIELVEGRYGTAGKMQRDFAETWGVTQAAVSKAEKVALAKVRRYIERTERGNQEAEGVNKG